MIIFQILLIVLVSAPVLALAFYWWFVLEENVRKRNREEKDGDASDRRTR